MDQPTPIPPPKTPQTPYPKETIEAIKTAYLSGLGTIPESAKAYGVATSTVLCWKHKYQWPNGPTHDYKSRVIKRMATMSTRPVKSTPQSITDLRKLKRDQFVKVMSDGLVRDAKQLNAHTDPDLPNLSVRAKIRKDMATAGGIVLGLNEESAQASAPVINIAVLRSGPVAQASSMDSAESLRDC